MCGWNLFADGTSCIDHTVLSCAPGESYTAGTDTEDGVCDACADGTYSAGGTETTCTPMKQQAVLQVKAIHQQQI